MPRASNNQMHFLQCHGIELPKPQRQAGSLWQPKKWFERDAAAIIAYLREGNGAGKGGTLEERRALYQAARQKYEGQFVVKKSGEDCARYLVLCLIPESQEHLAWVAEHRGVDPSQVNPFCFDMVAEEDPADYDGHIRGPVNLGDYRLPDEE